MLRTKMVQEFLFINIIALETTVSKDTVEIQRYHFITLLKKSIRLKFIISSYMLWKMQKLQDSIIKEINPKL